MADPWYDNASVIRTALTRLLEKRAGGTREIADLMQRLDRLEGLYRDAVGQSGGMASSSKNDKKPRYRRRFKQKQWHLAEARLSGGPDMLVPRQDYDYLLAILQPTKRAMSVEDLQKALARKLHVKAVPDYRVRVVIRFWLSHDPPLVEKISTAYRPVEPKKFKPQSIQAFDALPEG